MTRPDLDGRSDLENPSQPVLGSDARPNQNGKENREPSNDFFVEGLFHLEPLGVCGSVGSIPRSFLGGLNFDQAVDDGLRAEALQAYRQRCFRLS